MCWVELESHSLEAHREIIKEYIGEWERISGGGRFMSGFWTEDQASSSMLPSFLN